MVEHRIGKVVAVGPPLTVAIGSDVAQVTKQVGVWTPAVGQTVLVWVEVRGQRITRIGCQPIT